MRTRRILAAVAAATSLVPATVAAAADPPASWTYTDGSGRTVELDGRPERLVMHASAAAGLIRFGIRPVAIFADQPIESDPQLRGLDLDGIEIVGEEWGVINLEAVAAARPDLIVSEWWPVEEAYTGMEEGTPQANGALFDIAPVVGVAQGPSVVGMIHDYEQLAASLGADVESGSIATDRERFEAAVARFEEAVAAKPELTVLAVSPTPESLWVAVPEHAAELSDFVSWGMQLVTPEPDPGFPYWQELSWEQADLYPTDLLIVDDRTGFEEVVAAADEQPTWRTLPAVAAGQVAPWPAYWMRNYGAYADQLDQLTAAVEAADEHVVD
jgi:iron-desferrioxamine transport system substrate-binding protein